MIASIPSMLLTCFLAWYGMLFAHTFIRGAFCDEKQVQIRQQDQEEGWMVWTERCSGSREGGRTCSLRPFVPSHIS